MMFLSRLISHRMIAAVVFSVATIVIASPMASADVLENSPTPRSILFEEMLANVPVMVDAFTDSPGEFRFITPIAPNPHDPGADFDADLLPYLTVRICRVSGSACTHVKTFTSNGALSERLRIESKQGKYFIANWTTASGFDNTPVYRISVEVPGETLGSVDLPPSAYRQWGRTWPIKFIVEKDPALRIRLLSAAGMSLWEVADNLRSELGICDDELNQLLLNTYPSAAAGQVEEVVNGVCQDVVLAPNTKIADTATRDALTFYDLSTGQMLFAGETALLKNLRINDVLVGKPSSAAPYGYLRKVRSIRKDRGMYALETVQAKITEAVYQGTLQSSGDLRPSTAGTARSDTLSRKNAVMAGASFDEGDQLTVDQPIDLTINLEGEQGDVNGTGTVRILGHVYVKAGYNIGAGIELCPGLPPVCVDRLEAWMGFEQKSNLRVIGDFDGSLHKEKTIYPVPMEPIIFFIGPLPVILVPQMSVIVGVDGEAHIDFEFAAEAESIMKPYLKWTEDQGWQDLSNIDPLARTFFDADITGSIRMEAYAKLDAALLLYGAIGPSMDGSLGIGGTAQTGQRPFWTIFGHAKVGIGLRSIFTELFDIGDPREGLLDETFLIMEAPNIIPDCSNRPDVISTNIGSPVYLGPTSGFGGYFTCSDPEGEAITYSAVSSNGADSINQQSLTATFGSSGPRTVTVSARDASGGVRGFDLRFNVFNAAPDLTVTTSGPSVPLGVQYFVSATAFDLETLSFLTCDRINWSVESPNTRDIDNIGVCGGAIVFNREGTEKITVVATDIHGAQTTREISVFVTPRPDNLPPVIDNSSMTFYAYRGVGTTECIGILNTICFIPNSGTIYLWSGFGTRLPDEYVTPLYMNVLATDPEGDPVTYEWRCETGSTSAPVTDEGGGTFSCTPAYVPGVPITVYALVSDGVNAPRESNKRTFLYRNTPN